MMTERPLPTTAQKRVLDGYRKIERRGHRATLRAVASVCHCSHQTVYKHSKRLAEIGWLLLVDVAGDKFSFQLAQESGVTDG